ncbi:MAG TPA: stalk domain-containing protein, partial [Peptococcaceae bacterium]|nr:stalk domain-containing protein [Peptococcaceae bacterium]
IGEDITLVATVVDNVGDPLEDVTVVFQKSYENGSWVTIGQVETDDDGIAELDVEETRAGKYKYKAYLSTDKNKVNDTIKFNWEVAKIAKIVAKTADGTKIAVDEKYDLEFYLYDASGYLIKGNDELAVDFIVVDQPKDGDIDDEDGIVDSDDGKSDGIVKISITPAEVGTYEFKLRSAQKSTVYDTVTIKVQEYGTTEDMEISLADDKPSVTYGADETADATDVDGTLSVKLIDEEGVKKQADPSNLSFGSSNRDVVEVDQEGNIIVVDEDFIGEVTITVIDEESGISKDFALNVVGQPVSMNPVVTVNGLKASVEMQYVDKNGTRTYSGAEDVLKVVVPAKVTSSNIENFDPDSGIATFDLAADEAGEYTIVATSGIGISKSFKVAFEGATSSAGAKKVIMFIGRTEYVQDGEIKTADVAPFIRDNRTFVAVRPIADAFGVTPENIDWDETTKTVTLTRDDITVTIVIGSSDISVVKDGVTSTVTADVPAFIQDGRTVLPFRAVGEAFGAEVDYDQATQSVTYTQK